jgi:hypothetical protein
VDNLEILDEYDFSKGVRSKYARESGLVDFLGAEIYERNQD